jgi:type III secretion protein R
MVEFNPGLLTIIVLVAGVGLVPLAVVTLTAFLKIAVVLFIVRNALGIQQTPPNIVLYAITLVLTIYISAPLIGQIYVGISDPALDFDTLTGWQEAVRRIETPLRSHLLRFTDEGERQFLLEATGRIWPEPSAATTSRDDLVILVPSFVITELTRAFEIGFILYLPFIIIDLVVSNVLMAMGMMMVSPMTISVPFKLFLFVLVDGWSRLTHGVILSYE